MMENINPYKLESALARLRGYFSHQENKDKLVRLKNEKKSNIWMASTPTGNSFFDAYSNYFRAGR
jgi:hypothetical protein